MNKPAFCLIGALAAGGLLGWGLPCQAAESTPPPNERLLQQELKQQQIRTTTQRVGDQLASIINEFDRNGIGGEDVKVLRAIRGVLGKLTDKDMDKVVQLLQQTRQSEGSASTKNATDAYAGQKMIITQLNQLVLEYQRQQALYELSLRFKEFANRESTFMWQAVQLAKKTEGRQANSFSEEQQNTLRMLQIDQEPIKDELLPVIGKLEKLAKEINDGPTMERPKAALQQIKQGGLVPSLDSAVEDLRTAKLLSATGNQKKARDQFREIARLLLLSQGELEALRQAIHELDQTIDQQKELAKDTRKMEKEETKVEPRQAQLVDSTDLIRRDVDSIAPVAVEQLKAAMDRMQEARAVLNTEKDPKRQREKAPPRQDEAVTSLEQARRSLQEQLAKAEEQKAKPENTLAGLKESQEQLRELIQKQEALKADTAAAEQKDLLSKAPSQGELRDKAQELQQHSASTSPLAAQSIGEAASQMQKAQDSLANSQNNAPAQQAAIDSLQKADQQMSQDIARLEQAKQELAALEELLKKVVALIEGQQKVEASTAKEAVKPSPPPLPEIAGQQEKLGKDASQLQEEAETPVPAAAGHLGEARGQMDAAKGELDKPAPKDAQPRQTEALAALYAARRDIEAKMDELKNLLGLPMSDPSQALADAASMIEQAQKDVSQAMSRMQQSPPGLMEALQQQQKQIADALGKAGQDAPPIAPVKMAEEAAKKAAQQLANSNLPSAVRSMQAAQQAMQEAMKSAPSPAAAPGDSSTPLPPIAEQQAQVRKTAEALLAGQQTAPASALKQAADLMDHANSLVGPLAAGEHGGLPPSAQAALQSAQGSLTDGSAQAGSGQSAPAQASAGSAAQALAKAQAALALAQAGLGSDAAMAAQGQGQGKGQGQGQGEGQAKGQGQGRGEGEGPGTPGAKGNGQKGNWAGAGGADGPRQNTTGSGRFTSLPKRDRAAIQQSQAEKYPQEYGPLVEQYLKNLSDQSSK